VDADVDNNSAVVGVVVAAVDGVSAASRAFDRTDRVIKGGSFGGFAGEDFPDGPGMCSCSGSGGFVAPLGETAWELPRPPNEPRDPDSRLEKLLLRRCVPEDLLDVDDCDHRFKFPTPSLTSCLLSGR
jgi:hypothetical protein